MLLAVLLLTVGCSDDAEESSRGQGVLVELAPYASNYTEVEALTRALNQPDWAPDGYYKYSSLTGISDQVLSNEHAAICAYFTHDNPSQKERRKFRYFNQKWMIDEEISASTYQLYGFVPYGGADVDRTVISPFDPDVGYSSGVKMELKGMNSVMNQDVCVVVGVGYEQDNAIVPNPKLKPGTFNCQFKASNDANDNGNVVYLLFDHLYAALRFRFRLADEYALLRSIHLKKLELMAFSDEACEHPMTSKVKTTVWLRANNDGTSPIVGDINFESDGGDEMDWVGISSGDVPLPHGKENGEYVYTDNLGFVPKTSSCYMLRSTYDVYDNNTSTEHPKGNLIRSGCTAVNKIDPRKLFNQQSLNRGSLYTLRFTVQPTYLYVLSEPDLDNPTVEISVN